MVSSKRVILKIIKMWLVLLLSLLVLYLSYKVKKLTNLIKYITARRARKRPPPKETTIVVSPYKESIKKEELNSFNVVDYLKNASLSKLIKISKMYKHNYNVAVFNLNGSLNVGTCMRTASLFGCTNFFILGRKRYNSSSVLGSDKYMNIIRVPEVAPDLPNKLEEPIVDVDAFINFIDKYNMIPIFVEQGGIRLDMLSWKEVMLEIPEDKTICFVFGNESHGIHPDILGIGSIIISVPQFGLIRSHNVSVTAGIVLWNFYEKVIQKNLEKF